jgi:IS30 family transposase
MAEGPMLKSEEQMELAVLRKHGASIRELARMTGRSRNTVPPSGKIRWWLGARPRYRGATGQVLVS